jgi:hypothetical protein
MIGSYICECGICKPILEEAKMDCPDLMNCNCLAAEAHRAKLAAEDQAQAEFDAYRAQAEFDVYIETVSPPAWSGPMQNGPKPTTLKDITAAGESSPIEAVLAERGTNYGDFSDNAEIAQTLKDSVRFSKNWLEAPDYVREATDLILSKIARCFSGDPLYVDSWTDIQGYAKLVEERLIKETK